MLEIIVSTLILVICGYLIAKNYDAKIVLFGAGLLLMFAAVGLGHPLLPVAQSSGLSWLDPFVQIKQIFDQLAQECDIETQLLSFGEAYLAAISRPELLATRRLAQAASDRTDTGRNFYTRGPQRGTAQMSDYMARQITLGVLEPEDPWVMAEHLRALLEAEVMEKLLLGVMTSVTPAQIQATVQRGIRVFLRAYRVQS